MPPGFFHTPHSCPINTLRNTRTALLTAPCPPTHNTCPLQARLDEMAKIFEYDGQDTCAADGMCQEKCPVKINTGELVKQLRSDDMAAAPKASRVAMVRSPPPHGTHHTRKGAVHRAA